MIFLAFIAYLSKKDHRAGQAAVILFNNMSTSATGTDTANKK
jgi:hypothetical protein